MAAPIHRDLKALALDHEDVVDGPALARLVRRHHLERPEARVPEGAQAPGVEVVDPDGEDRVRAQPVQPEPREQADDARTDAPAPQVLDADRQVDAFQNPTREALPRGFCCSSVPEYRGSLRLLARLLRRVHLPVYVPRYLPRQAGP